MCCRRCWALGVLITLLACPAAAQEAEPEEPTGTYIWKGNFKIVPCVERIGGLVVGREECREGWFTLDRASLDRMLTITQSERDCRAGEARRLEEPEGWNPFTVVLVAGGIVVTVGVGAFVVGYAVGTR